MNNETIAEYYSRLYTPEQLKNLIEEKKNLLDDLLAHKIPAIKVIGRAVKAPRKQAIAYLTETIDNYSAALKSTQKG